MQEFLKGTFKIPVNETNLDRAVQLSATQHEAELIVQVDSLKKENKTELSHVSEIYLSQLDNVTKVNQEMNALLSGTNQNKEILGKKLNKLQAKFAEGEKKMSILEKKLQKYKESKKLIKNLNRNLAYKDNQIKSQNLEIAQLKDGVRKMDKEFQQFYGLVKKNTDKLEDQMSNFAELEHEKSLLKRKSAYLQRKLHNMDKIRDIDNTEFKLLKKESEEFR